MKIFFGIFGLGVLLFALSFALSNRQDVTLSLWPVLTALHAPLYLVGLGAVVLGIIVGGFAGWVVNLRQRWHCRRLKKEMEILHEKIGALQNSAIVQTAASPRKNFWSMRK